jgi:hypothetical protein
VKLLDCPVPQVGPVDQREIGVRDGAGREHGAIQAVINEVRARRLKARPLPYIYSREFELPTADDIILNARPLEEESTPRHIRPPRDLPPYLQDLYRQPLLSPELEKAIFRRYNYLKFKADRLRARIDPLNAEKVDLLELVWSNLLRLYEREAALAWLFGLNPVLGDRRPIDLIREGRTEELMRAIRAERSDSFA